MYINEGVGSGLDMAFIRSSSVLVAAYWLDITNMLLKIEENFVNREKLIIASIDVVNVYPYIKLITTKIVVRFFTKVLTNANKNKSTFFWRS